MRSRYHLTVGFSDHTNGMAAAFAAVALGADVVDKHLTFSRLMYGSDAANAMEPSDFRQMADGLAAIWSMRTAPVDKDDLTPYREMKLIFEKSVVTARPIPGGQAIDRADLAFKKPGDGISAAAPEQLQRPFNSDRAQAVRAAGFVTPFERDRGIGSE